MKKNLLVLMLFSFLVFNCGGKDDGPSVPRPADLIFPEESSECTEGISVSSIESDIIFVWNAAKSAHSYQLTVTHIDTNTSEEFNTTETQFEVTLLKGEAYSWFVTSLSGDGSLTAESETWYFYNAGGAESYAPFPASSMSPNSGLKFYGITSLSLSWTGNDIDNDITGYDVYFDNVNPPVSIVRTNIQQELASITSLTPGVYYWKIITKDAEGNTSDSGVYQFQIE